MNQPNGDDRTDEFDQPTGVQESAAPTTNGDPHVQTSHDRPPETVDSTEPVTRALQSKLKKFTLTRRLGSGGFGTVWLADDGQLNRRVAIKTPHPTAGEKAEAFYKRVLREGRAAAALQHPNIVAVYEVDEVDGIPYIVCEYIDGISLAERLALRRLPVDQAINLAIAIAEALAHAHEAGVIHRDLKPANILLNSAGVPHIGDFGIAKHESVDETISSKGSVIGTPAYMSPEQAQGFSQDADARSDIYSMGVVIFEMVTGERPFRGNRRMLVHQVIHDEPPSLRKLEHSVPRDLDTVCLKCLQKDPARRYSTCRELVDELKRIRDGEPIVARPISRAERLYRLCKKHRTISTLAFALVASLVIGLLGVSWQWKRAEQFGFEQKKAREAADRLSGELAAEVNHSRRLGYNSRLGLATEAWHGGEYARLKHHLELAQEPQFERDRRDFGWYMLADSFRPLERIYHHNEFVTDVAISPDQELVAASGLRTIVVWNNADGKRRGVLRGHDAKIVSIRFSPDGRLLASLDEKGAVRLWDVYQSQLAMPPMKHPGGGTRVRFNRKGDLLGTAGRAGNVLLWDTKSGQRAGQIRVSKKPISDFAWMLEPDRIAVGSEDATVTVCDTKTRKPVQQWSTGRHKVVSIAVHPENDQIVASLFNGDLVVLQSGQEEPLAEVASDGVKNTMVYLKSRPWLASVNYYGLLIFRDVNTMSMVKSHRTHGTFQIQASLAFSTDEKRLVIGSSDGTVKLFKVDQLLKHRSYLSGHVGPVTMYKFSQDGMQLISTGADGRVNAYDPQTGVLHRELYQHGVGLECVAISPDGTTRAFGARDGSVVVQDAESGEVVTTMHAGQKPAHVLLFLSGGKQMICAGADGGVRLLDPQQEQAKLLYTHSGVVRSALSTEDDKTLITAGTDGKIRFVDTSDWEIQNELDAGSGVHSIALSNSGQKLAVGLQSGSVRVYDLAANQWQTPLPMHAGPVQAVVFTPTDNTIISAGNDKTIVLADLEVGEQKSRLSEHIKQIRCLALSPDGTVLVSSDTGGDARLWRAPPNAAHLNRFQFD